MFEKIHKFHFPKIPDTHDTNLELTIKVLSIEKTKDLSSIIDRKTSGFLLNIVSI